MFRIICKNNELTHSLTYQELTLWLLHLPLRQGEYVIYEG